MNEVKLNTASVLYSIFDNYVQGYDYQFTFKQHKQTAKIYYFQLSDMYCVECTAIESRLMGGFNYIFEIKNNQNNNTINYAEHQDVVQNNLSMVIDRIRGIVIEQEWPQDLVDKMFKTDIVDKAVQTTDDKMSAPVDSTQSNVQSSDSLDNKENKPTNMIDYVVSIAKYEPTHILDKIKETVSPNGAKFDHYEAFESADHFIVFNMKKNKMFISAKTPENQLRYSVYCAPTNWDKKELLLMIDASIKTYKQNLKLPK